MHIFHDKILMVGMVTALIFLLFKGIELVYMHPLDRIHWFKMKLAFLLDIPRIILGIIFEIILIVLIIAGGVLKLAAKIWLGFCAFYVVFLFLTRNSPDVAELLQKEALITVGVSFVVALTIVKLEDRSINIIGSFIPQINQYKHREKEVNRYNTLLNQLQQEDEEIENDNVA